MTPDTRLTDLSSEEIRDRRLFAVVKLIQRWVVDEIQMVRDPHRGARLELVLYARWALPQP